MSRQSGLALQVQGRQHREDHDREFLARIRWHARTQSELWGSVTTDQLRSIALQYGLEPSHPNTWGAILKGKCWKCIGRQRSSITSNHGRFICIYTYEP